MNDRELKNAVRDAVGRREEMDIPAFDAVWSAAEARYRRARRQNRALGALAAAVALVAVAILVAGVPRDNTAPTGDEFLIADALMNATHWQAPSDALLPEYRDDIYGEIPLLMESGEFDEGSLL